MVIVTLLQTILWLAFILGLVVLIHELGHFLAAKIVGIKVQEFAFGMGKKIWGKKVGETEYKVNLIPFGGYVKLLGEEESSDDPRSFSQKPFFSRLFVIIAGVLMNFILATLIFYAYLAKTDFETYIYNSGRKYSFIGAQQEEQEKPVVDSIIPETPADEVGFPEDVVLYKADGKDIKNAQHFGEILEENKGKEIAIEVRDRMDAKWKQINVTPQETTTEDGNTVLLGVYYAKGVYPFYKLDYSENKLFAGLSHTVNNWGYQAVLFYDLIATSFEEKTAKPVYENAVGVVGMTDVIYSFVKLGDVFEMANFIALINLSLVMVNLIPIPALDGGQALIIIIEKISGKKIPEKYKEWAIRISFILLITLAILINVKDIFQFDIISRISTWIKNLF